MAGDSGITTLTHYIPIYVFTGTITNDIKNLISKHGHKNCGLKHEELCTELKKFINQKKTLELSFMDEKGKTKWNSEWSRKRNEFLNRLYDEEGFINMCFPKTYQNNQRLNKLLSKHIDFCKKKDVRRAEVVDNPAFSKCIQYNSWIESQRKTFTNEYLDNVSNFTSQTVDKYFSTKEHPQGRDPRLTYRHSKLDCDIYNPASKKFQKELVEKAPTNRSQSPGASSTRKESLEKDGSSVPNRNDRIEKEKPDVYKSPKPKSTTPNYQIHAPSKTQTDGTHPGQDTHVRPKAPASADSRNEGKTEATATQSEPPTNGPTTAQDKSPPQAGSPLPSPKDAALTPIIKIVPETTTTTSLYPTVATVKDTTSAQTPDTSSSLTITQASSLNPGSSSPSLSPSPSDPLLPAVVTKDHDKPLHSTTAVTSATTHSTETLPAPSVAISTLPQPQPPALNTPPDVTAAQGHGTHPSSSASTVTTTATTTTMSPLAVTSPTMSATHKPISSAKEATSVSSSQEPSLLSAESAPKATAPTTRPQQTFTQTPTSLREGDTKGVSVPAQPDTIDNNQQTKLSGAPSPKTKDLIIQPEVQPANSISTHSAYTPSGDADIQSVKIQETVSQTDTKHNISAVQIGTNKDHDPSTHLVNVDPVKISLVNPGKDPKNNPVTPKGKNDNPNIIPEEIPPLTHIIPTLLVILATLTLLFQLYKYTPFGYLLGRRRKRKKQDLKRILKTPQKPTYESPNIALHEWEDHNLLAQTVENDVYIKLLKINRYKQEMKKRKKENKKTLIEVHMEVFEEYKNDEWELHKGDFLEICLRGFINEDNDNYQNFPNSKLTINNINEKTIEDIQKQEILWNNWIEDHRNILEQWKKEEWFHILKNKWIKEQQKYKENNNKLQENILNEEEKHSIVILKEIWKQWIEKQATLIDMFNKEDWFKSMVYVQDKEKDNYHINEYNNISLTSKTELKNEKMNHEHGISKNIIQKLMVQIHMMVLEECIKDDIIKHKELCIDNFIEDIHNQNNYDEKRNMPKCYTHDFSVPEYEEIHISTNK